MTRGSSRLLRRDALGDLLAVVQDDDAVRERHDRAEKVLDHEDREPAVPQPPAQVDHPETRSA